MANYFDISDSDWQRGKEEMRVILQGVAARRGMIAYSELSNQMTTMRIEAFGSPMSEMLGEITEEEDEAGRGLLTVIVVHKTGDQEPGISFFDLAATRGRDVSDRMALWVSEFKRVQDFWTNR
jgi:molybdopterin synthase catalytic subunit